MKNRESGNKRRGVIFLLALMIATVFSPLRVFAEEVTYTYVPGVENELDNTSDMLMEALPDGLPDEMLDMAENAALGRDGVKADGSYMIGKLAKTLNNEIYGPVRLLSVLLSLVTVASVYKALSSSLSAGVSRVFGLCSLAVFSVSVFSNVWELIKRASELLEDINVFLLSLLPVFTSVYAAGGNVAAAAYTNSGIYLLTGVAEKLCAEALLPLCRIIFALVIVGAVSSFDLSGAVKTIKDTYSTVLVFSMLVISAVYSFGNSISAAKDSVGMRAVRFAAGNFIPVVGGAVSEVMRTVAGSLAVIKTAVGWVCCAALILMLAPPVISLILYKTAIELASSAAKIAGMNAESRLLDGASAVCGLLCAAVAAGSVLFILAVTVFTKTAVGM